MFPYLHGTLGSAGFTGAYDAVPDIVAAYGMRRLLSSYESNLLRIRRSSDNAEQDFGYDADGHLDVAAIATFIGGGSGFVTTWYDQSGNANNVTQATADSQPLYVASGQNGLPVVRFDGTDDRLGVAVVQAQPSHRMLVGKFVSGSVLLGSSSSGSRHQIYRTGSWAIYAGAALDSSVPEDTNWHVFNALFDGAASQLYLDGMGTGAGNAGTHTSDGIQISGSHGQGALLSEMDVAELVIAGAAWSTASREAAEAAANDYWSVY